MKVCGIRCSTSSVTKPSDRRCAKLRRVGLIVSLGVTELKRWPNNWGRVTPMRVNTNSLRTKSLREPYSGKGGYIPKRNHCCLTFMIQSLGLNSSNCFDSIFCQDWSCLPVMPHLNHSLFQKLLTSYI